jgi:hypothetical protein
MDLSKTHLIESVFAGGGERGAPMRALDWSSMVLRAFLRARLLTRRYGTDLALVRIEREKETDR